MNYPCYWIPIGHHDVKGRSTEIFFLKKLSQRSLGEQNSQIMITCMYASDDEIHSDYIKCTESIYKEDS